jgi:hypothetical protein
MTFDVASQLPVVLLTCSFPETCGICDHQISTDKPHILLPIFLHAGAFEIHMHKHCANSNGFGTDLDRVSIGAML